MSKNGTVILTIGNDGELLAQRVKERLGANALEWITVLAQGDENEGHLVVSGENPLEMREGITSKAEELLARLGLCYRSFLRKESNIESLRYLLLGCLYGPSGVSLPLELAKIIRRFHQEVASLPCMVEGFLILPPLEASKEVKGWCYAFLKELDSLQRVHESPLFDLVLLAAPDRLSASAEERLDYLSDALTLYLSTDVYENFHQQMMHTSLNDTFLGKNTCYSSLGIYRLIFPVEKWIDLLSWKLCRDILSLDSISPFEHTPQGAEMTLKQVSNFMEETNIGEMVRTLAFPSKLSGTELLTRGLLEEDAEITQLSSRFYDKLHLLTQRKTEEVWGEKGIGESIKTFVQQSRTMTEKIMDGELHGPFSAYAFIANLRGQKNVYTGILRDMGEKEESVPPLLNIPNCLLGWKGESPSEMLKVIFEEITGELERIYGQHFVPWKRLPQWEHLWQELENVTASDKFKSIFGEDWERIQELNQVAERIKRAKEKPYSEPLAPADIKENLLVLEKQARREMEKTLAETRTAENKEEPEPEEEEKVTRVPWFKRLFRKRAKSEIQAEPEQPKFFQKAQEVIHRRERLLPCYFLLRLHDEIMEETQVIQREVGEFKTALGEERMSLDILIQGVRFPSDPTTYHIAQKEDIPLLYYHRLRPEKLGDILEEFYCSMGSPGPPAKLSDFYRGANKEKFLLSFRGFARTKFLWLKDWNAEDVLLHLGRIGEMLHILESSCVPILGISRFPTDKAKDYLYVGVEDVEYTKLLQDAYNQYLQGGHEFYTAGKRYTISGLKLVHAFPLFAVEGMTHFYNCYRNMMEGGIKLHPEGYEYIEEVVLKKEEGS